MQKQNQRCIKAQPLLRASELKLMEGRRCEMNCFAIEINVVKSLSLSVSCSGAVAGGADLASVSVLHSCGGQVHQSACL